MHQHSENACQHLKNTGTIHYFTTLIIKCGGPSETTFVYSFGVPSNRKGSYDGIHGTFKNKIHRLIQLSKTLVVHIPGPDSGYINTVKYVFDALVYIFQFGNGRDAQQSSKNKTPINRFNLFLYIWNDSPVQQTE